MHNLVFLEVLDSLTNLSGVTLHFKFMQALPAFHELTKSLVFTEGQQDVNIIVVFKVAFKVNNVVMLQRPMDLDFTVQFLPCSCLDQGFLGN